MSGRDHRRLIAPRQKVADFIADTYTFDEVKISRIGVTAHRREWAISAGVRTTGSAGNGRREWYGAQDLHPIRAVVA